MKKRDIAKFFVFLNLTSLSFLNTSCSFNNALIENEKTIDVTNLTESFGSYTLSKEKGKIGEEIIITFESKAGYQLEYCVFNNKVLNVENNMASFIIEEKNNITIKFSKQINSSNGYISFAGLKNSEENISNLINNTVCRNVSIASIDSNNVYANSSLDSIAIGDLKNSGEITINFKEEIVLKSIKIKASINSNNTSSDLNISFGTTNKKVAYTSKVDSTKGIEFQTYEVDDKLKLSINEGYQLIIKRIDLEYTERKIEYPTGIKNKYSNAINLQKNKEINILNYVIFSPYDATIKDVDIVSSSNNLTIDDNLISSSVCGSYYLDIYLKNNHDISTRLYVNIVDTNEGVLSLNDDDLRFDSYKEKVAEGKISMPSTGNSKIIVVPIQFSDFSSSYGWTDERLSTLKTTVGVNQNFESTSYWESLASYYYKSSYGKLKLDITVADVCIPSITSSEFLAKTDSYGSDSLYLIDKIYSKISVNGSLVSEHVSDYDSNSDGYIDGIWFIYNEFDFSNINSNRFWAYTYWYRYSSSRPTSLTNCKIGAYANMGAGFMYRKSSEGLDSHTLAHETGHMLGLDDYYTYATGIYYSSNGGLDMMDRNVGDHSSFSKYQLGWITPKLVDMYYPINGEIEVKLRPFESSGDSLIIPTSSYNNSAFSEYIILEYYTPTGLNEHDSKTAYVSNNLYNTKLYTQSGLKAYHVDSRIAYYDSEGFNSYISSDLLTLDVPSDTYGYYYVPQSNTPTRSINSNYKLVTLISKQNMLLYGKRMANNSDLFYEDDELSYASTSNYFSNKKFNNGDTFDYTISVKSITDEYLTLTISKD